MKRLLAGSIFGLLVASALAWAAYTDVLTVGVLVATSGVQVGSGAYNVGSPNVVNASAQVVATHTGPVTLDKANDLRRKVIAAEAVAAAETIEADACGTVKRVTAAGAVTTNTTDTFTAPAAANDGCVMYVCNTSANAITLDDNANFFGAGIAGATPGDTVLGADDCCIVASDGAAWRQLGACAQG